MPSAEPTLYEFHSILYTTIVFQRNKKVEVCLVVILAFVGQDLRSIVNVAEWALKEPSYGAKASMSKFCTCRPLLFLCETSKQKELT